MRQPIRTIALAAVCMTVGAASNQADAKPEAQAPAPAQGTAKQRQQPRAQPKAQPRRPAPQPELEIDDGNQCPYAMRGVKLTAALENENVVFEFTNPRTEYVRDVRAQLREAAELIQELSRMQLDESMMDPDMPRLPPLAITVKDMSGGARVVIKAMRNQDRAELRELAAGFAEFWEHSDCAVSYSVSV